MEMARLVRVDAAIEPAESQLDDLEAKKLTAYTPIPPRWSQPRIDWMTKRRPSKVVSYSMPQGAGRRSAG